MTEPDAQARTSLAHDLRGPLVTIEGFAGEIDDALAELEGLLGDGAPAELVVARLAALLAEDLRPCLDFLGTASRTLHERLDALDGTGPGADDDATGGGAP